MEITNLLWTVGGLAFFTGLVVGIVLYYFLAGGRAGGSSRTRIAELEAELKDYQNKVADHFSTSAHLVNRLTETYRDVHEHLATSANELCTDELTRHRLNDALLSSQALTRNANSALTEQPKDYAPKKVSDEGTLSENFRVADNQQDSDKDSAA
ncbi:YhcB family protein [Parendozoicomonas haliclonae]|uniref:Z-ring associated protein G n=1 Tax=Parendozoicomonas haliclonae TaxID=1960125 RepID=A0A1X7AR70_9GAMM|nr:DUF1043 family protein [Parendozoicomonas haliclonae]SMA50588.1 hypothetical protein EHSB41UT_04405 [Parendozoicomonas haliclonae]